MTSKYEFIDGEKANYRIIKMCDWAGVSKAGFYDWRNRPMSATTERRAMLGVRVKDIFDASHGTYGYRRVHAQMTREGLEAGPELVRRIMTELGLVACQPKPFRVTTIAGDDTTAPADLVCRDFTATAPGTKLVGDITYIATWQGWVYLATVIDCYSKMVIGYAMADHMRTSLVTDALDMAYAGGLATDCIFHSDRGCQYTSHELADYLAAHDMRGSMGRTGICWDNAMAESFFAALKNELVYRTVYTTKEKAIRSIAHWIEIRYNRKRLHSGIGYRTPLEAHNAYHPEQAAA